MHEKVLPQHSLDLLTDLEGNASPFLSGWTLAGGTGLAFHLGHRISEDLDFFRADELDVRKLHDVLGAHSGYETLQEAEHTLTVLIRETKLSFFRIRDPFLFDAQPHRFFSIASVKSLALFEESSSSSSSSFVLDF